MYQRKVRISAAAVLEATFICLICVSGRCQSSSMGQNTATTQQVIRGAEHPEVFSRRQALETVLNLLAIDQQSPVVSQSRIRLIESKRMGLGVADAMLLEQIVETYRVQRDNLEHRAQAVPATYLGRDRTSAFMSISSERKELVRLTLNQIGRTVSTDGKNRISAFASEVIAKSELQKQQSTGEVK